MDHFPFSEEQLHALIETTYAEFDHFFPQCWLWYLPPDLVKKKRLTFISGNVFIIFVQPEAIFRIPPPYWSLVIRGSTLYGHNEAQKHTFANLCKLLEFLAQVPPEERSEMQYKRIPEHAPHISSDEMWSRALESWNSGVSYHEHMFRNGDLNEWWSCVRQERALHG
jgi:hypothetical protein